MVRRGLGWGWFDGSRAKKGGDKGNCVLVYAVWIGGGRGGGGGGCGVDFGVAGTGLKSRIGRL